jgi:mRNA interferase MazF
MVLPSAGEIVLLPFPFSDLSAAKVRPAVSLADAGRGDWVLCQITSSSYGDPFAVPLNAGDFEAGVCLSPASHGQASCLQRTALLWFDLSAS